MKLKYFFIRLNANEFKKGDVLTTGESNIIVLDGCYQPTLWFHLLYWLKIHRWKPNTVKGLTKVRPWSE